MRRSNTDEVIIEVLKKKKLLNARELAELGNLNYNTVRGRVQILTKRKVLEKIREGKRRVRFRLKE